MRPALAAFFLPALLLAGCPTKAKPDTDGGPQSDGPMETTPTLPSLQVTSPADGSYTNGTVTITVAASGGQAPATITLLDGSTPIATLDAPSPYTYSWDTTGLTDGPHTIGAKATVDSQTIFSAPITINVDHTAPSVEMTTPSTGATDVVLRAPITITFSEPMAASSLSSSSVTLKVGGAAVATTVTLSADGTVATIAIDDLTAFALPSTFAVTLASTITDLAGNTLSPPLTVWSWTVPDFIDYGTFPGMGNNILNPLLMVTSAFQPVLAYADLYVSSSGTQQFYTLHVQSFDGQNWTDLGRPSPNGNENNGFSLALDAEDHPVVAWSEHSTTSGADGIYVAAWDGAAWGAALTPVDAADPTANATAPILRLDTNGLPVVGWLESLAVVGNDIFLTHWTGTQWNGSPGKLGLNGITAFDLVLDGQGNPIVGWRTTDTTAVYAFRGTTELMSPTMTATNDPTLALDQMADPLFVEKGTAFEVYSFVSGVWQVTVPVSVPASATAQNPKIRTGPDHNPLVGWIDSASLGFARWTGTAWEARAGLFTDDGTVDSFDLTVDSRGTVWLAGSNPSRAFVLMSNY
jgi:hypothetical protein